MNNHQKGFAPIMIILIIVIVIAGGGFLVWKYFNKPLMIVSPNGGERFGLDQVFEITWKSVGLKNKKVNIQLVDYNANFDCNPCFCNSVDNCKCSEENCGPALKLMTIASNLDINIGKYSWKTPVILAGSLKAISGNSKYKIRIETVSTEPLNELKPYIISSPWSGKERIRPSFFKLGNYYDESDNFFTIGLTSPNISQQGTPTPTAETKITSTPKDAIAEKMETDSLLDKTTKETIQIKLYFHNKIIQERECPGWPGICPDGTYDCELVFAVMRTIPKTKAVARAAIEELLKGPTQEEISQGYYSGIATRESVAECKKGIKKRLSDGSTNSSDLNPWGLGHIDSWGEKVELRSLKMENGIASVDFSKEAINCGTVTASCGSGAFVSSVEKTLKQFPTIKKVEIFIDGKALSGFF